MGFFDKPEEIGPDPDQDRLAALEARVSALEARLAPSAPGPTAPQLSSAPPLAPVAADDTGAWLDQVAGMAAAGDRAGAIALYRQNMSADEQEAASFVDSLIADPPKES